MENRPSLPQGYIPDPGLTEFQMKQIQQHVIQKASGSSQEEECKPKKKKRKMTTSGEGASESSSSAAMSASSRKASRIRTSFSQDQIHNLEEHFKDCMYPTATVIQQISNKLGLGETTVQVWFQNRRAKWRKPRNLTGIPGRPSPSRMRNDQLYKRNPQFIEMQTRAILNQNKPSGPTEAGLGDLPVEGEEMERSRDRTSPPGLAAANPSTTSWVVNQPTTGTTQPLVSQNGTQFVIYQPTPIILPYSVPSTAPSNNQPRMFIVPEGGDREQCQPGGIHVRDESVVHQEHLRQRGSNTSIHSHTSGSLYGSMESVNLPGGDEDVRRSHESLGRRGSLDHNGRDSPSHAISDRRRSTDHRRSSEFHGSSGSIQLSSILEDQPSLCQSLQHVGPSTQEPQTIPSVPAMKRPMFRSEQNLLQMVKHQQAPPSLLPSPGPLVQPITTTEGTRLFHSQANVSTEASTPHMQGPHTQTLGGGGDTVYHHATSSALQPPAFSSAPFAASSGSVVEQAYPLPPSYPGNHGNNGLYPVKPYSTSQLPNLEHDRPTLPPRAQSYSGFPSQPCHQSMTSIHQAVPPGFPLQVPHGSTGSLTHSSSTSLRSIPEVGSSSSIHITTTDDQQLHFDPSRNFDIMLSVQHSQQQDTFAAMSQKATESIYQRRDSFPHPDPYDVSMNLAQNTRRYSTGPPK